MGYQKIEVYKLALRNLGTSNEIQNINLEDRNCMILNLYYETARDKVLMDHDWNFASTYRVLALAGDNQNFVHPKFIYKYDYPNDCLMVRGLYLYNQQNLSNDEVISFYNMRNSHSEEGSNDLDEDGLKRQEFEVIADDRGQKTIFTNISPAIIRYTRKYTNTENCGFTPEFAMLLSWYLAALAATAITGARARMSDCFQMYRQLLREAKTADANESYVKNNYQCEWITARDD
ncbi:MAG: hypothetical protein IKR34_02270 [Candidatus Gastranaerophilales bacterium]|nr:hypothetical protein [Elusimicrobiota bacterium]MBR6298049.1 hypothetical protein [Candidatus Gastranaerophilales bacterium]